MRPARSRYSVTTFEPGAREVLTHGLTFRPFWTAFFASRPAASITDGFEVLVQLVIAAITTGPLSSSVSVPSASVSLALVETPPLTWVATGSLAGNESASASSSSPLAGR